MRRIDTPQPWEEGYYGSALSECPYSLGRGMKAGKASSPGLNLELEMPDRPALDTDAVCDEDDYQEASDKDYNVLRWGMNRVAHT